jgi:hypothetical protein
MTDPASTRPPVHPPRELEAIETVGGVLTDLIDLAEQLPVKPGQAEPSARILDRLSEELAEAAGLLRGGEADRTGPADLQRLRAIFPDWHVTWAAETAGHVFTAGRPGFEGCRAPTAALLAARIFDSEAGRR